MDSRYCRPCWIEHNPTQLSGRYWRVATNTAEYTSSRSSADASTRSYANGGSALPKNRRDPTPPPHPPPQTPPPLILGRENPPPQQIDWNNPPSDAKLN